MKRFGWIFLLVAVWVALDAWLVRWWWIERRETRAEPHLLAAAREYGVEPALVKAVAWRESRFREDARGTVGELGLMQVGPLAAEEWAKAARIRGFQHADLLDPARNARAGAWYLAKLMRRYPQADVPEVFALADYNAGRVHVLRWLKGTSATNSQEFLAQIDFPGTRDYVNAVIARRDYYRPRFPRPGT